MSMFLICKHTIQESYESGHRKSTDNVTEIYCDNATFMSKLAKIGLLACWSPETVLTRCKFVPLFSFCCSLRRETVQLGRKHY